MSDQRVYSPSPEVLHGKTSLESFLSGALVGVALLADELSKEKYRGLDARVMKALIERCNAESRKHKPGTFTVEQLLLDAISASRKETP